MKQSKIRKLLIGEFRKEGYLKEGEIMRVVIEAGHIRTDGDDPSRFDPTVTKVMDYMCYYDNIMGERDEEGGIFILKSFHPHAPKLDD